MDTHNTSCKSEITSNIDTWESLGYIALRCKDFSKKNRKTLCKNHRE